MLMVFDFMNLNKLWTKTANRLSLTVIFLFHKYPKVYVKIDE
jgi:hypothetical protein